MQSLFSADDLGFLSADDLGLAQLVEFLRLFELEACMCLLAILAFHILHGGFLDAVRSSKENPSKLQPEAGAVPVPSFGAQPVERDYCELIKVCGQAQNLDGARELWKELSAARTSSGTARVLSSMVEALVASGCPAEAWELVHDVTKTKVARLSIQEQIHTYSSLLRGFAKAQQHSEVCELYSEMRKHKVPINTISANTVLNSKVYLARLQDIPEFLAAMKAEGPRGEPDIVTFSTIIKGYCKGGEVDASLSLVNLMMQMNQQPDQFTFNSLLDGCVKHGRFKEALQLVDQMKEQGVPLSNYTLSIVVKALGRTHRLGQAYGIVEEMSRAYGFKPNIQVYTCLMQACFHSRRIRKAFALYNKVVEEDLAPLDSKTYAVLARGCINCGAAEEAALVVRAAHHLPCTGTLLVPAGRPQGVPAECSREVLSELRREDPEAADALQAELAACTPSPRR